MPANSTGDLAPTPNCAPATSSEPFFTCTGTSTVSPCVASTSSISHVTAPSTGLTCSVVVVVTTAGSAVVVVTMSGSLTGSSPSIVMTAGITRGEISF